MSEPLPGVGAALSELAGLLLSTESFVDLLQGVAELSVRAIEPVATCGITLSQDDRVFTAASADALACGRDEEHQRARAETVRQHAADRQPSLSDSGSSR